jgi:hypothetical protein
MHRGAFRSLHGAQIVVSDGGAPVKGRPVADDGKSA